jgi:peptidoglycan/xylan/chitin deacetylase (PgdA/CDA1 family)
MSPRWKWDFEDEPRAARVPASSPAASPRLETSQRARQVQFRRRRAGAAIAMVLVLVLILVALTGSHHRSPGSGASARAQRARVLPPRPKETQADEGQAVASILAYTPFIREGTARVRDIALTFDDGPGPYTPGVLSVLEQAHVRATFFAIGKMERYFSASTVRAINDGDVIGDHTESHPFLGSFNATTLAELRALHLLMVLWSVDTGDYAQPGVQTIVQRVLEGAHPGAIILMHDGGGDRSQTIAALPLIIRGLRARGFQLVTVPQLLMDDPPPHGQSLPSNLSGA